MATKNQTGFDKYLGGRMKDPSFAAAFREARAEVDGVDGFIRAVEAALTARGMSKAELARRLSAKPESVRRLLSDRAGNPTLSTILGVLGELDLQLEVAPRPNRRGAREARPRP